MVSRPHRFLTDARNACYHHCVASISRLNRPRRLAWPRTSPFHGGNTGSNPVGDAKFSVVPLSDTDRIPMDACGLPDPPHAAVSVIFTLVLRFPTRIYLAAPVWG